MSLGAKLGFYLFLFFFIHFIPSVLMAGQDIVVLDPIKTTYVLGAHMSFYEDREGRLGIDDVSSTDFKDKFSPWPRPHINLGICRSSYWLRFTVQAPSSSPQRHPRWLFDPGSALYGGRVIFRFYQVDEQRSLIEELQADESRVYHLVGPADQPLTYYLNLSSDTGILLSPTIYSVPAYLNAKSSRLLPLGLYYGVILAVIVYYLFTHISLRDPSYLWYALHLSSLALFFLGVNGITGHYVLRGDPNFLGLVDRGLLLLTIIFAGLFTRDFLMVPKHSILIDQTLQGLMWLAGILFAANIFLPPRLVNICLVIIGLTGGVVALLAGISGWIRNFRPAIFFLVAWSVFLLGGITFALSFTGILPYNQLIFHGFQIGSGAAAILFSVAFGQRIKTLHLEKESFKKRESRVRTILDKVKSGVILLDPQSHRIVESNQEAARIVGISKQELIRHLRYQDIFTDQNPIDKSWPGKAESIGVEAEAINIQGHRVPVLKSEQAVQLDNKELILLSLIDITERKRLELELEKLATTDPLTGVNNRREFLHKAQLEISRAKRYNQTLALLMMDIDFFKNINDRFGHHTGDLVLQDLSKRCMTLLRDTDVFARIGGEEFAALCVQASPSQALLIAERIRQDLEGLSIGSDGTSVEFTVSIGLTSYRDSDSSLEELLKRADDALYEAKRKGRNQCVQN